MPLARAAAGGLPARPGPARMGDAVVSTPRATMTPNARIRQRSDSAFVR
jgi:hypothetical protein